MFSFQYQFYPDRERPSFSEFLDSTLLTFLAALYRNGQVLDEPWNLVDRGDRVAWLFLAPEEDSPTARYDSRAVAADRRRVEEASLRPPVLRWLGPALESEAVCECHSPSRYVLFTTFIAQGSPVICGDCGGNVPLYRFPFLGSDTDYTTLLHWEAEYQAWDTLYIQSGSGERAGLRQMTSFSSRLTQEGLETCRSLEAACGTPSYYYLSGTRRTGPCCPGCGQEWRWEVAAQPFKLWCEQCRLVSSFGS